MMLFGKFGEGPLFTITNYIYWFTMTSILFWAVNALQLFVLVIGMFTDIDESYMIIFYLASILTGPALATLLSVTGKLVRENDLNVFKDFFKAYKENFKQSILLWIILLVFMAVINFDAIFFLKSDSYKYLTYVFIAFGILAFIVGIFAFAIMTRFSFKTKDLIKLAFYYLIKKFYITIAMTSFYVFAFMMISGKYATFAFIYLPMLISYATIFVMSSMFKDIEQNFIKN